MKKKKNNRHDLKPNPIYFDINSDKRCIQVVMDVEKETDKTEEPSFPDSSKIW